MKTTILKRGTSTADLPFYGMVALIFITAKLIYPYLATENLKVLLTPISYLVSFFTDSPISFSAESGYYLPLLNIVIDKSCSGFNFWLIGFIVIAFSFINNENARWRFGESHKIIRIIMSILMAYGLTIIANTSRIISIIKMNQIFPSWNEQYEWLHAAQGTFVYLFFLIGFYLILHQKSQRTQQNILKI